MSTELVTNHSSITRQGSWGGAGGDYLDRQATDQAMDATQAGTVSHVAREEAELKAAIVVARRFPRDDIAAYARIMKSCDRASFAAGAAYSFPRGGQQVTGPSVDLARELARCWGNIRYGLRVVTEDEQSIHIRGYAYDLETNNLIEHEDRFRKLVFRKSKGWVQPDERDLRELVNRRGAILVRNCLLQLLPPDVVEDAMRRCGETNDRAAKGEFEQDPQAAIRSVVGAFGRFAVTPDMLAAYVGHPLNILSASELAELRKVYASIKDGNTDVRDHFDLTGGKSAETVAPTGSTTPPKSRTDQLADEFAERLGQGATGATGTTPVQAEGPATQPSPSPAPPTPATPEILTASRGDGPTTPPSVPSGSTGAGATEAPGASAPAPSGDDPLTVQQVADLPLEQLIGVIVGKWPPPADIHDSTTRAIYVLNKRALPDANKTWGELQLDTRVRALQRWLRDGFPWK